MIAQLSPFHSDWYSDVKCEQALAAIERERELVCTPQHLTENVVGESEFAWDFRCLGEGFRDLVEPYWSVPSGVQPFLAHMLQALRGDEHFREEAALLVEFVHMGVLINDHYSCHPELARRQVDRHKAHSLTQLRYAGQFLSVYPRYLLARNRFRADETVQIRLHKLVSDMAVTQSIGRGLQLKWLYRGYADITTGQYRQHGINAMANYVTLPFLLAVILSRQSREQLEAMKPVAGHLALIIKLSMEREVLRRRASLHTYPASWRSTACLLGFPGFGLVATGRPLALSHDPDLRFPDVGALFDAAVSAVDDSAVAMYDREIRESIDRFQHAAANVEALAGVADGLTAQLVDTVGGAGHA